MNALSILNDPVKQVRLRHNPRLLATAGHREAWCCLIVRVDRWIAIVDRPS